MTQTLTDPPLRTGASPLALTAVELQATLEHLLSLAGALCCPVLLLIVGYGLACWIWPFRNCHDCHGTGRRRSPTGRAFRACRACSGTGGQLRLGRRLYHRLAAKRRSTR